MPMEVRPWVVWAQQSASVHDHGLNQGNCASVLTLGFRQDGSASMTASPVSALKPHCRRESPRASRLRFPPLWHVLLPLTAGEEALVPGNAAG